MYSQRNTLIWLVVNLCLVTEISCVFVLTKTACSSLDKNFCEMTCPIKAVNRTHKIVFGKMELYKVPVTKIKVNMALFRQYHDSKAVVYNFTFEGCKVLDKSTRNPVSNFFMEMLSTYSNLNHSCPYNHDLMMVLPYDFLEPRLSPLLPFPNGDYLVEMHWIRFGNRSATAKIYFSLR